MCGVTNPPVTPPPLTPARPTVDSQLETGQDRRTREKGGGGRGVCGSVDHGSLVARERERRKKQEVAQKKTPPPPTQKNGETTGKRGKGNPPTQRKKATRARGRGKTRQGAPHQPRRTKESATRQRRTRRRKTTKPLGVPRLVKGVQEEAGPRQRELVLAESLWGALPPQSRQHTKRNKSSNTQTITILSSLSCRSSSCHRKKQVVGTMHPPPRRGPRKTRTRRQNKARSLKGSENHTIFPQSKSPKQEAKTEPFLPKHP